MDRIKVLYNNLSKSEKKALKTYLDAFHVKGENKSLDLLSLLEKNPKITQEEAADRMYGNPRSKGFIMMKGRLFDKMVEFLPLSVNPGNKQPNKEIPFFRDLVDFRKNILAASFLQEKRLPVFAKDYYERALRLARSCNSPELEVDTLLRLRGLGRSQGQDFDELTSAIRTALAQQACDINAIGIYRKFYELHTLKSAHDDEKVAFLETNIPPLEEQLRQHFSARAAYYVQMLKVNYFNLTGEYEGCKEVIAEAVSILDKNPGIRSRQRMSDPWFQLGLLELNYHHYAEALVAFERARSFHPEESRAYLMTSTMMLYALIYQGKLTEADALTQRIYDARDTRALKNNPMMRGMFMYLDACVFYLHGSTQKAWLKLQEIQELNFDKAGWITGIRIFEIIILIEAWKPDLASQKLENLRKHLSRHEPEPRSIAIYKLLLAQEKNNFAFAEVASEADLLEELDQRHRWNHVGHEVIRFDTWYHKLRENPPAPR